jgi:hypothetical protein
MSKPNPEIPVHKVYTFLHTGHAKIKKGQLQYHSGFFTVAIKSKDIHETCTSIIPSNTAIEICVVYTKSCYQNEQHSVWDDL